MRLSILLLSASISLSLGERLAYMKCDRHPESCQNACFWIRCLRETDRMRCEPGRTDANRQNSGCQYHPCTQSQACGTARFVNNGGKIGQRGIYRRDDPSCDEFLPNKFFQTDDTPPQALRCTSRKDNSSGGQVFKKACQRWPYPKKFYLGFKHDGDVPMCNGQCTNNNEIFYWAGGGSTNYRTYTLTASKRDDDPIIERRYRLSNDEVISLYKKESEPNDVGVGSEAMELQVNGTGPVHNIVEVVAEVKAEMFAA